MYCPVSQHSSFYKILYTVHYYYVYHREISPLSLRSLSLILSLSHHSLSLSLSLSLLNDPTKHASYSEKTSNL